MKRTISQVQKNRLVNYPDDPALFYPKDGDFIPISNKEFRQMSLEIGMGLHELGMKKGERIAIMANTRYEWDLVDSSALNMGNVVVAIYPTTTAEHTQYILQHSGAKIAVLEDASHWQKVASNIDQLPDLQHIIMLESEGMPAGDWVSLDKLREIGREALAKNPDLPDQACASVEEEDLAGLVYTSGTTGMPKGVALTHLNLHSVAETLTNMLDLNNNDTSVVYLPMAHILQRVNNYYGRMAGIVGYFAPEMTELISTCKAANPSSISGVPRVYEKIHAGIMAKIAQAPEKRQQTFHKALAIGVQRARLQLAGKPVPIIMRLQYGLYDQLIFKKLRTNLFGENIRLLASGAAPISTKLLEFFHAVGLPIYEGYGLTETSSPITLNIPGNIKLGSVGPPLPGAKVNIAEDGEILLKGPGVFKSYYNNPEATAEAFTDDGWFKTGDIGEIDSNGFLKITDRKKNLIITAAGKNMAPAPIENKLIQHPLVGQVVVHGDQRKYLVALFTLDPEAAAAWAAQNGKVPDLEKLSNDPDVIASVEQFIEKVNNELAQYETVKYFRICPQEWGIDDDTLTPTLKLKRRVIEKKYGNLLNEMYA